jgi:hypothetical protein
MRCCAWPDGAGIVSDRSYRLARGPSYGDRMLDLRPACERCDAPLPPTSADARICSYECTFCAPCADGPLAGRCPNCGGDLQVRPRRVDAPA